MINQFVHLKVHTEYSIINGMTRIKSLLQSVIDNKIPAVAITDQSYMSGQIRFYQQAMQKGVKPICGCDLWIEDEVLSSHSKITLLCLNQTGYKNLMFIVSLAFQKNQILGKPICKPEWIKENSEGLIALSGANKGEIGKILLNEDDEKAEKQLREWMNVFVNRFYIELQRTERADEEKYINAILPLADKYSCPVVATNDVMFLDKKDFEAHEARVCIGEGQLLDDPKRPKEYSQEQYFKTPKQMIQLFHDIPEAIENSVEIAKRCNASISLGKSFLPVYPIPPQMTVEQFFRKCSDAGLKKRLEQKNISDNQDQEKIQDFYFKRLNFEINVILQMGYPGYFLIVMDFIQWSKKNNIPVGPGRGSGAGSLVAYALEITDLDPLEYDLLFERFLNPERVSMPDFDIDFCMESRDKVIQYVAKTYGQQAVSQIITFGTMAAKAVVRDIARVQGKSYSMADKLSKLIPFELNITLEKAFNQEENLRNFLKNDSSAQEVWDMSLKLEGLIRNVGKHAGGVVIAPEKLTDFTPLSCDDKGQNLVTQYDKNDVEQAGLVKFDFLGLRTLTIIDWTLKIIHEQCGEKIDITKIDLKDKAAYTLLKTGETTGVFQLESQGMQDLIKRLQPDCFEDIIALVALFRPGPLQSGMVDNFINRKHGREKVSYPDAQYQHKALVTILDSTYGIILYQEQVMQIAQVLAGYSLGQADLLRRAMGKKKPEEMAKQRSTFEQGAIAKGVDGTLAIKIFDLVEKFAGYGFNKSHSAAYALVSYQTLWLKAHYPAEFMAAVLSSDMQNTDKVVHLIDECQRMNINVQPPQINKSHYMFTPVEKDKIIFGLGAIKGVGEGPIDEIVIKRENSEFKNIFDLCSRVDIKKFNRRTLEALIKSGTLDELAPNFDSIDKKRGVLKASTADAVKAAEQANLNKNNGITDLFADLPIEITDPYDRYITACSWKEKERLQYEKETLGIYFSGHPLDELAGDIEKLKICKTTDIKASNNKIYVAGIIVSSRVMRNKKGDKMAFLLLDDVHGRIEISVFSDTFIENQYKIVKDNIVVIQGVVQQDTYSNSLKIIAREVFNFDEARCFFAKAVHLTTDYTKFNDECIKAITECCEKYPGETPIKITYSNPKASVDLWIKDKILLSPVEECIAALNDMFNANIIY